MKPVTSRRQAVTTRKHRGARGLVRSFQQRVGNFTWGHFLGGFVDISQKVEFFLGFGLHFQAAAPPFQRGLRGFGARVAPYRQSFLVRVSRAIFISRARGLMSVRVNRMGSGTIIQFQRLTVSRPGALQPLHQRGLGPARIPRRTKKVHEVPEEGHGN